MTAAQSKVFTFFFFFFSFFFFLFDIKFIYYDFYLRECFFIGIKIVSIMESAARFFSSFSHLILLLLLLLIFYTAQRDD